MTDPEDNHKWRDPNWFPLWRVMDMSKEADQSFAAVGTGIIDFKSIFADKKQAGMKYFFVEHDK